MKVGDLVRLPPTVIANNAKGECVGVILKKHAPRRGPSLEVGTPRGIEMWNERDVHLLVGNK